MRACGDCSECCRLIPTVFAPTEDEFEPNGYFTPTGDWCKHCAKPGCNIYGTKQQSLCLEFKCSWQLDETIPDNLKPNKVGVVLQPMDNNPNIARFWIDKKNFTNTDVAVTELEKYATKKYELIYDGEN
jgi:hypothetical protein